MKKFHVNDKGQISRCFAHDKKCPYGGESGADNHYDSVDTARKGYEEKMKGELFSSSVNKYSQAWNEADLIVKEKDNLWKELDRKLSNQVKNHKIYKYSNRWFAKSLEKRAAFFSYLRSVHERDKLLPESVKEKNEEKRLKGLEEAAKKRARVNPNYDYHPIMDPDHDYYPKTVISSFSGLTREQIDERVKEKMDSGMSYDDSYTELFYELPLRNDKPIVAIDIEVAADDLDLGSYSNIIEVGYIIRQPNGEIEEKSYLCGVPEDFAIAKGTGAEHVHNISLDMIKDKKPFVEDIEKQKELLSDLDNSVLLAHNARYEVSQFLRNLPGFHKLKKTERTEILDTQQVCRFFCRDSETLTNESFVKTTGGEYTGAHRAFEDANMSLAAFLRLKGIQE